MIDFGSKIALSVAVENWLNYGRKGLKGWLRRAWLRLPQFQSECTAFSTLLVKGIVRTLQN